MSQNTLTWPEFLQEAEELLKISQNFGDIWSMYKKNDAEGNSFLIYKQKISLEKHICKTHEELITFVDAAIDEVSDEQTNKIAETQVPQTELVQIEYHIVYSISYQVPVLYFQAYTSSGKLFDIEDAWQLFDKNEKHAAFKYTREELLQILTQMEHPVLFKPFLALHPCRTAELLAQAPQSRNRVLTFISVMGPFVKLNLNNKYGLIYK